LAVLEVAVYSRLHWNFGSLCITIGEVLSLVMFHTQAMLLLLPAAILQN